MTLISFFCERLMVYYWSYWFLKSNVPIFPVGGSRRQREHQKARLFYNWEFFILWNDNSFFIIDFRLPLLLSQYLMSLNSMLPNSMLLTTHKWFVSFSLKKYANLGSLLWSNLNEKKGLGRILVWLYSNLFRIF